MGNLYVHSKTGLTVVVRPDPTGGVYAVVPALPGCGSQGESVSEALTSVSDAITIVLQVLEEDEPERYRALIDDSSGTASSEDELEADSTAEHVVWAPGEAA